MKKLFFHLSIKILAKMASIFISFQDLKKLFMQVFSPESCKKCNYLEKITINFVGFIEIV